MILVRSRHSGRGRCKGAESMRIAMIGAGYVGLVSGACIADFGHHVICVYKDNIKISALNAGEISIYEPGLDEIVQSNGQPARLSITTVLSDTLHVTAVMIIVVGT